MRIPAILLAWAIAASSSVADEQSQIDFADGLFARGFNEEAAEEYRAYLEDFPDGKRRLAALYRLGESETALRRYDAAIEALDQVLAAGVEGEFAGRARLRKGAVLIELKRPNDAVKTLEALIGHAAHAAIQGEALYFLGKAHAGAGRNASAISAYSRLARDQASSPFASMGRYQLAFAYVAQGDLEKAALAFSELGASEEAADALRMEAYFRAAEAYDKLGWFDTAVTAYDRLDRDFPDSAYARRARYGHAWALYRAGKLDEAIATARDFLGTYPESPYRAGTAYLIGNALQQRENYDEALSLFEGIRSSDPESEFALRAQYKMAWVLYLKKDRVSAKREIDSFLANENQAGLEGEALFLQATILLDDQAFAEAGEAFQKIYTTHPGSEFASDAVFKHGECLNRLERFAEAAQTFTSFAETYPEHLRKVEALVSAGDAHFRLGEFERAILSYQQAVGDTPPNAIREDLLYRIATAHHNRAAFERSAEIFELIVTHYTDGRFAVEANLRVGDYLLREGGQALRAVPYFETALKADPEGPFAGEALKGLALARYETKDFDGASQTFIRVMSEWTAIPLNEKTYAWVGQHLFDREEWGQSIIAFEALLRNVPDYPNPERVLYKLAECAENSGRGEEAVQRYARVVDAMPRSATALDAKYRMARLYEKQGDIEKSIALYDEGANANNGETAARSRFQLGVIFEKRQDYEAAAKHFMRVAILFFHPELSPESLWRAGQCFEKNHEPEQALKTYREMLREYPESARAQKARERIEALAAV